MIHTSDGLVRVDEIVADDSEMESLPVQLFVHQLRLFGKLCAGRNSAWKSIIGDIFSVDYLVSAIWRPECEKFRGSLE